MMTILGYLGGYLRANARPRLHLTLGLLLAAAFYFNYSRDFKRSVLDGLQGTPWWLPGTFLFYALPYVGTLLLTVAGTPEARRLRDRRLWAMIAVMLAAMTACRWALTLPARVILPLDLPWPETFFWQRVLMNAVRVVTLVGSVWLFKLLWDRGRAGGLYGLQRRGFPWRPYLSMLLVMVPPIVWASFQPAFRATYPICRPEVLDRLAGWNPSAAFALHELFYALRFIGVELWFRGFLVLGMVRRLGPATLPPMVVLYAFWHFGKPMPEALGAIFGAYILGIIALRSGSINGGIVLHMGVNLLMNLAAYGQWVVR